jgi:hypothetical protein
MALIPSAFVQVRAHVAIENWRFLKPSEFEDPRTFGTYDAGTIRFGIGIGLCTAESHSLAVDDRSHVLNVALIAHRSAYTVNATVMCYLESHVA